MQDILSQNQWAILILQLWTIPWKGLALWIAAGRKDKLWFVILLLLQTIGLLDIIYIFFIAKYKFKFPFRKK